MAPVKEVDVVHPQSLLCLLDVEVVVVEVVVEAYQQAVKSVNAVIVVDSRIVDQYHHSHHHAEALLPPNDDDDFVEGIVSDSAPRHVVVVAVDGDLVGFAVPMAFDNSNTDDNDVDDDDARRMGVELKLRQLSWQVRVLFF
jgi:hypothetical protein